MLPIICLPLTYQLPQALFCYWGTSFAFTTAQIFCQRTAAYRRLVEPQDDRTEDATQAARHRQSEGAVVIAGDKEGAEDVGLDRAEAARRAAAGPGGGEGEGGDKMSSLHDSASSLEDLNARIAHVQATLKDSPAEQRKAMMDIMVQRMTYERLHVLRAILEEVHSEVQRRGGHVDEAACQLVRQGIDDARAAGKIIALPPVEVVFNVVALDDLPIISMPPPVVTTEDTEVSISIEVSDAEGEDDGEDAHPTSPSLSSVKVLVSSRAGARRRSG